MLDAQLLKLNIRITRLTDFINQGSDEKLFIRYYIPAFGNRRIQIDTREIQSSSNVLLNEFASVDCHVNSYQIEQLESSHIRFELRSRRSRQIFGGIMTKSKLLGGGEISWKDVMGSKRMELEEWVNLRVKSGKLDGCKMPKLLVKMNVQVTRDVGEKRRYNSNEECDWVGSEIDMYHVETIVD